MNKGRVNGHYSQSYKGEGRMLHGDGCQKWGIEHCADCTRPDCDFAIINEPQGRKEGMKAGMREGRKAGRIGCGVGIEGFTPRPNIV